jgi:glycolate oxidase iron-sulfur subunit
VEYGRLVEIGRPLVEEQVTRPLRERWLHWLLREALTRRWIFANVLNIARALRFLLPQWLRRHVPEARPAGVLPKAIRLRKVLLPRGCVQPSIAPSIDAATARVLDAMGVQPLFADSGCCGAIRQHLHDPQGALQTYRRNIDAWWPGLADGSVEAIVINASGCATTIREYGYMLRGDAEYAEKARRVSAATRELGEFVAAQPNRFAPVAGGLRRVALQLPCSLQHGLRLGSELVSLLRTLGAELQAVPDSHLCCGSSGTYSILQPQMAQALRDRKLAALTASAPELILTANIGCMSHLASGTSVPVWHWIEWVDRAIQTGYRPSTENASNTLPG